MSSANNDFLELSGKCFIVFGLANKRSVGWASAKILLSQGATVFGCVKSEERAEAAKVFAQDIKDWFICDVENEESVTKLGKTLQAEGIQLDGMLHSIAYAQYDTEKTKFYETSRANFLQACQISAFSLVELSNSLKDTFKKDASVVTIGISSTEVTAENYGYMAPIKAALNANVRYLAKSFSDTSEIRFNAVNAGPLKTKASAGIPGYLKNFLYAEELTFRKRALEVEEVANTVAFLLSKRSTGINGQGLVVNAGMDLNYFDSTVVDKVTAIPPK